MKQLNDDEELQIVGCGALLKFASFPSGQILIDGDCGSFQWFMMIIDDDDDDDG